ncbi:SusE domain-containing protein [Microbacter margulisiae]|uniref:SusE outer membrane protein domain-containing protein n=1 Tax=Microbacter margulisiae TaxID=1350067 RepID=A0A7W5DNV5_9PORP|nr:SusE domain-containing protein [Microbacter margulisiae]MBB3186262.1 hypothetical protein [Microbacter margulisiae]
MTNNIFKWILALFTVGLIVVSCTDNTPAYIATLPADGTFTLHASDTTIALSSTNAGSTNAVTFSWDSLTYGVSTPVTYTLQVDTLNGTFSNPIEESVITNSYTFSYSDSILNLRALKLNLKAGQPEKLKVRLKSSLAYNQMVAYSNVITLTVTPYTSTVLKYAMPTALYLQGSAVASNWGYPVPDAQKMVQIDDHRFALLVSLTGGGSYDFITTASSWGDPAYRAATSSEAASGGNFIPSGSTTTPAWGGSDIPAPATSGVYQVIVDFTTGTYTVTAAPGLLSAPSALYIVGDATPLGWAAPDATQKFTQIDANTFALKVYLTGGKTYALITAASTWTDPAFILPAGSAASSFTSGGEIIASGAANNWAGVNMQSPSTSGTYTITANFKSGTFIVSQ